MRKMTIMIIANQPLYRAEVRHILAQGNRSAEIEIIECDPDKNGNEAIAQIAENLPNIVLLVLLDIGYPFCNGLDLAKKIARRHPGSRVVVFSTNPEEDDDELFEAIKSGAAAYLRSMSCSPSELVETIWRASTGEYPINDAVLNKPKLAWRVLKECHDMASMGKGIELLVTFLTPEEIQILTHIAEGNSNKLIGNIQGFSEQSIHQHISAILRKLNANDRVRDAFIAVSKSLINPQLASQGDHLSEMGLR